jgi:hypothetical protein
MLDIGSCPHLQANHAERRPVSGGEPRSSTECRNSPGTHFAIPLEATLLRCKRARWPPSRSKLSAYDGKPREGKCCWRGERFPGARLDQLGVSALEVDHVAGVHKIGLKKNMNGVGSLAEKG